MHTDTNSLLDKLARALLKTIPAAGFCLCLASACSHFAGTNFPLSSVSSESRTHIAQQQWQLTYKDKQYLFQVMVERSVDHWQWIMLDNLSQRLATVSVRRGVVSIEQHQAYFARQLLPELLEALQFSYWSLADLQQIGAAGWSFHASPNHRDIYFSGILRATVDYQAAPATTKDANPWQGNLVYDNRKSHFQLRIESQLLN